jgi:hypothetical protein
MALDTYPHSPVPSDDQLWPGELPFTAFGQFGIDSLDKRVFEQDVWWVDRYGLEHLLSEMSDDYRRAVVWFCEDHIRYFWVEAVIREQVTRVGSVLLGVGCAEEVVCEVGFGGVADCEPEVWLESTPLMRKLRGLTGLVVGQERPARD